MSKHKNRPGTFIPPEFYGERYFVGPGKDPRRESGYRDYRSRRVGLRQAALAAALVLLLDFRSCVDVGCAFGHLVWALGALGKRAAGIEISAWAVDHAPAAVRGRLRQGSVLDLPFGDDAFDLAVAEEVLEHVDPGHLGKALRELRRVAGSAVFVTVPVADWARGLVPPEGIPRDSDGNPHHGHLTVADRGWWGNRLAEGMAPWTPLDLSGLVSPRPDQGVFAYIRGPARPVRPSRVTRPLLSLLLRRLFG